MDDLRSVTPNDMRQLLRQRRGKQWLGLPGVAIPPGPYTQAGMLVAFRAKLRTQGDRGLVNLLANLILETRNPFESDRRRLPKREVVTVSLLVAVLALAVVWFNFLTVR